MASADQISCRNLGRQSWASAPTDRRGSLSDHPGQRRTAERLRRGCEEMGGNRNRGHPKRGQQRRTIPQSRLRRASSLYTREPCPAGDGGSGRRVVGPYGKPKPAGAQRSVRARVGEGWAGIGARTIPKGGPPPRPLRQRLAKRKARKEELVKFGLCPVTSECSTGYRVRRSQPGPARAHADVTSSEQDSLVPRPAARQGASRARNCAATSVFSFDGSTAVFFLGLTKKKMGVESPPGLPGTPRLVDRFTARRT